ncbi:hypothetical protein HMPREF9714_00623 [Myroides odoratimimus CCUG 12901]|uniref:Uncharacterized protein n=2 Tax=Myroides odoratimimus TaxID=76832 RepID=A0ABN0EDP3_9FLAO|nr:hypothetical protein HMPREF9712_00656 [Myroides odoratimimus CCUG 10230]EHO14086.1 hypothetical protein HMPREF9714_00623 [Myroides odoratimimus CCUG 12901]EHO14750.1 hypothetical protein HMPREF9715_00635 [Myroides odoratimimus CIP 101113]SHL98929.1 hypothetical protein SAMN05444275_10870 [Myroides odoratimimus subsp. xuanwuensis]STZ47242.1 Uncharacterised protein [Myroides odoratimimus]
MKNIKANDFAFYRAYFEYLIITYRFHKRRIEEV